MLNDKIYIRPKKWFYYIWILVVMLLLLAIPSFLADSFASKVKAVVINDTRVEVELAATENERSKGLSERSRLASDAGMLFLYDTPAKPSFWMKGMRFPIDIVWIFKNRVVDFSLDLPVLESKNYSTYTPSGKVDAVLEVNAGWVKTNNVQVGDKVIFRY